MDPDNDLPRTEAVPHGIPRTVQLPKDLSRLNDPFPLLTELRHIAPVVRARLHDRWNVWLVTSYQAARHVLLDTETFRSDHSWIAAADAKYVSPMRMGLLDWDPPLHTEARRLVRPAFAPPAVRDFADQVRRRCPPLLQALPPVGTADLVAEVIEPLVNSAVGTFLGVPWDEALGRGAAALIAPVDDDTARKHAARARDALAAHVDACLSESSRQRTSLLARILTEGGPGSPESWLPRGQVVLQMFVAGRQSTVDFLATLIRGLTGTGTLARLRDPGAPLTSTVEEYLRHDGPIVRGVWRFAARDGHIAGTPVARGDTVLVSLAAANRDPAVFDCADQVAPLGRPHPHLGFGAGPHHCPGAPLVRVMAGTLVTELARRFPRMSLAPQQRDGCTTDSVFRGPRAVYVRPGGEDADA
ncbi:cytochrome P450 [Streptomyces sp. NPDC086147]|uniref:cytochrome P450 n=1 Tax=Streptomyces sp. NPDC086147 TaxID=3155295 RepID=UPI003450CD07